MSLTGFGILCEGMFYNDILCAYNFSDHGDNYYTIILHRCRSKQSFCEPILCYLYSTDPIFCHILGT